MTTCNGIDVSSYQGAQDWAALRKGGLAFAIAKASEGQTTRDTAFAGHIKGIIAAGLIPGSYHFAWPNQSAAKEAANYIAAVRSVASGQGAYMHWLDLEEYADGRNYSGATAAEIKAYAAAWVKAVQAAFPKHRVGIYTSGSDLAAGRVPAGVSLWYPAYPGSSCDSYAEAAAHTRPAPSGRTVSLWQFTSTPLDRNIAYMSASALRSWAGGSATLPSVDLSKVIAAAKTDPGAKQGHQTYAAGVKLVEAALLKLGYLGKAYASDGSFGSVTVAAYAAWQRHLGYSGSDADGIPGSASLTQLGSKSSLFKVVA